jgi:phosphoadenosine phosphosulfate reductase
MAGVKFTAYYNITTVDPPELVHFIREKYPEVIFIYPKESMWRLIVRHGTPPTRLIRYCRSELKEGSGVGRTVVTGVR